ncbi:MAG: nucleotidyltransferase family protein [Aristaeellaceae bacterium]
MRTVGIIAEYNPFHPGHAWQLMQARTCAGADCVAVVMSSCFTQRGDAAMLSPAIRARMALLHGADLVFALPVCWAVRDAERFALGGVRLLQMLGADAISFGAETADTTLLMQTAQLLENAKESSAMQALLGQGLPYPAALQQAVQAVSPEAAALLASPNNTLGICYLQAMRQLNVSMEVFPIARTGDYHATTLECVPSATALRSAMQRGDWQGLRNALPEDVFTMLRQEALTGNVHPAHGLDQALMYRLRTMAPQVWHALPDLSEGIEDRLRKAAEHAISRDGLLQAAKTRRYPYARLSRLCTHALLGITQAQLDAEPLPDALWLLGLKDTALPLLRRLKQQGIPVISKVSAATCTAEWFRTELLAYDLWALGCGQSAGFALRQGVVRL